MSTCRRDGRRRPLRVQWGLSQRACPSTGTFLNGRRASTAGFRTLRVKPQSRQARLCANNSSQAGVQSSILLAVVVWLLCLTVTVSSHFSFNSCSDITAVFRQMFADSETAKSFQPFMLSFHIFAEFDKMTSRHYIIKCGSE